MRNLLTFAGLMLIGSVVGCTHVDSGCNGCGGSCSSNGGYHSRCTGGICDCDLPALTPYGRGLGLAPQPLVPVAAAAPTTTDQTAQAPREMPKAGGETADK